MPFPLLEVLVGSNRVWVVGLGFCQAWKVGWVAIYKAWKVVGLNDKKRRHALLNHLIHQELFSLLIQLLVMGPITRRFNIGNWTRDVIDWRLNKSKGSAHQALNNAPPHRNQTLLGQSLHEYLHTI